MKYLKMAVVLMALGLVFVIMSEGLDTLSKYVKDL